MIMYPRPVFAQGTQSCGKVVPFSKKWARYSNHKHVEKWRIPGTQQRLKKKIRKIVLPTPAEKKKIERTPRATQQCTDCSPTSTTVSGRPASVDLLCVCANGASTKRYDPGQPKSRLRFLKSNLVNHCKLGCEKLEALTVAQ